jgi:hypothetical protein
VDNDVMTFFGVFDFMHLWQFVMLLAVHWFADFVLQTHWQAQNKSKNFLALFSHVVFYTLILMIASLVIFGATWPVYFFVLTNGALHLATDAVTSRITSRFYAKQDWHNFFVMVGFDQLIHQVTLAVTMQVMLFS